MYLIIVAGSYFTPDAKYLKKNKAYLNAHLLIILFFVGYNKIRNIGNKLKWNQVFVIYFIIAINFFIFYFFVVNHNPVSDLKSCWKTGLVHVVLREKKNEMDMFFLRFTSNIIYTNNANVRFKGKEIWSDPHKPPVDMTGAFWRSKPI